MHYPEVPLPPHTWTPTKGNDIPSHAIPLYEGPDGPLYIARGLLGGEIQIGTTNHSSSEGAWLRDRYGRSHAVFEYEVLTLASSVRFQLESAQPPTPGVLGSGETTPVWPDRRNSVPRTRSPHLNHPLPKKAPHKLEPFPWLRDQPPPTPREKELKKQPHSSPPYRRPEVPKQPLPMALNARENIQFEHLAQSKCFTLIDDTPSMQRSWSQTREALAGTIDMLSSYEEWDGVDVRFLHHVEARPCVKTGDEFKSVFNSVTTLRGEKVMTAKVTQVFEESLPFILESSTPRPVVLLIITDGIASDAQELLDAMIRFSQKLNGKGVRAHMFRIHILQMGEDNKAVKPLHDFRDRVTQRDRHRRILNVVSFHRARGPLDAQNIVKLLRASTHIAVEEDPSIGERQPARVIEAQGQLLDGIRAMASR